MLGDPGQCVGDEVHMALGINPSWDSQADKFQLWIYHFLAVGIHMGEHNRANFAGTDGAFSIEFDCQCLPREFSMRNVGKQAPGVNINCAR
jgi:hypothetical protein